MKENSKLFLGLGIGAVVGIAVGYLLTGENRKRLNEDLHNVGHGIKDGVKSAFSNVKSKAERAGADMAGHVEDMAEKVKEKTGEWAEKANEKANGVADDVSQKANDMRRRMDSKAAMDENDHEHYAENYNKDVDDMKNRMKGNPTSKA